MNLEKQYTNVGSRILVTVVLILLGVICKRVKAECTRLDRALATPEWINHYKDIKVHHLVESTSDHYALLITDANV